VNLLRVLLARLPGRSEPAPPSSLAGLEVRARVLADSLRAGSARSARNGSGIEPESIRRYEPGDDVRALDWRVTARRGDLHVRRFEEERDLDVLLVVDRSGSLDGMGTCRPWEAARDIAAALSLAATEAGHRTGLVIRSDSSSAVVPPGRARSQWRTSLAALEDPSGGPHLDVMSTLSTARSLLRSRGMIVLLGDFLSLGGPDSSAAIDQELAWMGHRHDVVPLVVRVPEPRDLQGLGRIRLRDSAQGRPRWIDVREGDTPLDLHGRAVDHFRALGLHPVSIDPREALAPQVRLRFGAATRRAA